MSINLFQEIEQRNFLLILLEENEYVQKLDEIIKSAEKVRNGICYVCLGKPYADTIDELKNKTNTEKYFFIDVLSSHYKIPEPTQNCIFISSPSDFTSIWKALMKAVDEKKCSVIIFDAISSLLMYEEVSSIIKFIHEFVSEKRQEDAKKLFIILKENNNIDDINMLEKDIEMFADRKIDMTI